ncbi:MAG: LamG domain-containing protein [Cyanobacteria bacterium K_Offshore_surface_m2_239]|nr:LamG domain-containing protein [Cyanobacteria bacterium K_Offshore_surface_m2_239]
MTILVFRLWNHREISFFTVMIAHLPRESVCKKSSSPVTVLHIPACAALAGSTILGLGTLGVSLPAEAALVANYQFQNTLSSAVPAAPDLAPFAMGSFAPETIGGTPTFVYNFGQQQGLSLNTSGLISDNYTIAALFKFNQTSSYRKIFDFKNLTTDNGLYLDSGRLNFYDEKSGGPTVAAGTFLEAVLTRDDSTSLVSAYLNGVPVFTFTDTSSLGVVSAAQLLNIFQDDNTTSGGESSSGSVAGIQIFITVLTNAEVANLDLVTPVPGPLPMLSLAAAFGWSRHLRKRLRGSRVSD